MASTVQLLAGDVGGTNTRLTCGRMVGNTWQPIAEKTYPSIGFSSLTEVVVLFLAEHDISTMTDAACFAVAGPVENGIAAVTNLPWVVTEQELEESLTIRQVMLLNDLVAAAYGISNVQEKDILTLQSGEFDDKQLPNSDAVVIAAGTGFGAAHLVHLGNRYHAYSSEAGHVGFAPGNSQQNKLLAWLQEKHNHVSQEMLLSGKGLTTIYQFLHEVAGLPESIDIHTATQVKDPAQVISDHALRGDDLLCQKTLEMFIDIYGAVAGDMVLQYYPVGTLYITGGIAPKIRDKLSCSHFINAYRNKGLMSTNMKKITIKLLLKEKVGLYGALYYIANKFNDAVIMPA